MKPEQMTAWALDEASAEERQDLEAALNADPTQQKKAEDTKAFCHFLLSELRDDSLALTEEQRRRLTTSASTTLARQPVRAPRAVGAPAPQKATRWQFGPLLRAAAVAACLAVAGVWAWQQSQPAKPRHETAAAAETLFQVRPAQPVLPSPRTNVVVQAEKVLGAHGLGADITLMLAQPSEVQMGKIQPPVPASSVALLPPFSGIPSGMTEADVLSLKKLQDEQTYGLGMAFPTVMGETSQTTAGIADASSSPITVQGSIDGYENDLMGAKIGYDTSYEWKALNLTKPVSGGAVASATSGSAGMPTLGNTNQPAGGLGDSRAVANGSSMAFSAAPSPASALMFAAAPQSGQVTGLPLSGGVVVGFDNADRQPSGRVAWGDGTPLSSGEKYQRIVENEVKDVLREPLSTFSIDVDTAAYANVRRFLNQNRLPPADAVRIEELVNYFPAAEEGPAPGAKQPFAVHVEMAPCPWQPEHRLARIAIKGREIGDKRKPSNLVFLVDVSGSMQEPTKLPLVQQSLRLLTEQLSKQDRVTLVAYAGSSGLILPPTPGDEKGVIIEAINRLQAGGSTHGSAGIQLAYEQAAAGFIKEGVNRVILCTDGDFNVGISSPEELEKLITQKTKSGVYLSVLGFGSGNLQDHTMETLADKGNGNYAYIDSLSEARKVLVEQMDGTLVTIAKDVKIQVEFNPAIVRGYRLVGYENRMPKMEDFNDDTKDAGEIGAGHTVVALYEVVPTGLSPDNAHRPVVDGLRYQQAPAAPPPAQLAEAAKSGEVMTVKLRYKEPDSSLSKLIEIPAKDEGKTLTASSTEMKFSAAVAGFGLLLRDSAYKGGLSWETVRKLALDGKGSDPLGYRGEFLQLIDKARGLKESQP